MTVDRYHQLRKLACDELNIHEVREIVLEKELLTICVTSNLGYSHEKSEIFLRLGEKRIDKPELLRKIIERL